MRDPDGMPVTLSDFEIDAAGRLSADLLAYLEGGAEAGQSVTENRAAFGRIGLLPKLLSPCAGGHTRTTILGKQAPHPIMVAPMAFQNLFHPQGESATAMAAAAQDATMVLSCQTSTPPEDIATIPGRRWFQLYMQADHEATMALVTRAVDCGADALVVTLDAPINGLRDREVAAGFTLPDDVRPVMLDVLPQPPRPHLRDGQSVVFDGMMVFAPTADDLARLIADSPVPVIVKGCLRPADATRLIDLGAQGIIVSNHGGRVLDTVPAPITQLAAVVDAVAGAVPVYVDGGIRRGSDVFKALALGAQAVLVGRPVMHGLIVDGPRGASQVLRRLRDELEVTMALCGCATVADITPDLLTGFSGTGS
ncbi:alpha-hydroxy acid oxidase [Roseobacter sp. GAI101]|uniref:alpha-hydroxy acid oxidase n=1 Tax=Roseobacter sp. (strain GAI101) TaxID=391589 RepID=UPI0002FA59B5|nr:alpha-hydroxy acid oxidase [Roseobacter sp. GAI101]